MFEAHLIRWGLVPDGAPTATRAAHLLPVVKDGRPAMLKLSHEADERFGGVLMEWWDGDGAARVLATGDLHHGNVLDFGVRGWLAIDPKHLIGERGFDFANIFTNPDLERPLDDGRPGSG